MFSIKYTDIIEKIKKEKGLTEEEIETKIQNKLDQLGDLISKEGAAHIIANELGVKVFEDLGKKRIQIKDIFPGLSSINLIGKVITIFGVREFHKEDRQGKVGSFLLGDETGVIKVVLWDTNHIKEVENNNLKEGMVIKLKSCYTRSNNNLTEIHLGNKGKLILDVDENIGEVRLDFKQQYTKKSIFELGGGENNVGIIGAIVQVFEPKFYEICNICGKRVILQSDKFNCEEHGTVVPKLGVVANIYLDDGTSSIRVVAFREQAEELIGKENVDKLKKDRSSFEEIKKEILGKQILLVGRVSKNEMFDRLEFNAITVNEVNPLEFAEDLVKEVDL